jgi:glutamine amidotransferase-like uncharacterized protein/N-formylglutamate amidohydrolase
VALVIRIGLYSIRNHFCVNMQELPVPMASDSTALLLGFLRRPTMFSMTILRSVLRVAVIGGLWFANGFLAKLDAQSPKDLIIVEAGDLPIILTAPHGGGESIPGVPKRLGKGVSKFASVSDVHTDKLAKKLADAIEAKMGKRPFVVIARFHRQYLDANRRARDAYESPEAEEFYEAYHQAIADARSEIVKRWERGLLIDIHGQAEDPKVIFRGTQNGKTTKHLIGRYGIDALHGESSFLGLLAKQGIPVIPAVDSSDLENPSFDGGYTVVTHGSNDGGTVDAIQIELGLSLREPKANGETANKIANAIQEFSTKYLPTAEHASSKNLPAAKSSSTTGGLSARGLQVGVYVDEGASASVENLLSVLSRFDGVSVTKLKADDIRSGKLAELDLLIQPGGSGSGQGRHLGEDGRDAIRGFVKSGGGFIGICAGAYLASADYSWSLNILDAKVLDRQHWNRGKGTVDIAITDAGRKLLGAKDKKLSILYAQGPLLAPGNHPDIEDYETVATFETEIAKNGAPEGVMKGTTAIAKGTFGNGRVVCFSPHPEMTDGLEEMVRLAIDHVKRN